MAVTQLIATQTNGAKAERQRPVNHPHYDGFVTSAYPNRFRSPKSPSSALLAALRLLLIVVTLLIVFPIQGLLLLMPPPLRDFLPRYFHRFAAWVFGMKIVVTGQVSQESAAYLCHQPCLLPRHYCPGVAD